MTGYGANSGIDNGPLEQGMDLMTKAFTRHAWPAFTK